jgi:hypothetical protein
VSRHAVTDITYDKPFNAPQTGKIMIRYSDVRVAIVVYIWRTHESPVVRMYKSVHGKAASIATPLSVVFNKSTS